MEDKKQPVIRPRKNKQDLTGRRFGKLVVLERVETGERKGKWKCQCDCGKITYKATGHLNAGSAVSCGCSGNADLIGRRIGKLLVLEKSEARKGRSVLWKCRCECGNLCEKTTGELKMGFSNSCGCSWRRPAVHAGDRFGRLTALAPTEKRSCKSVIWICECDCGNQLEVRATMLTSGHTTSCGCVKKEIDDTRDFKNILTYVDETCIEFLKDIGKNRTNTSSETGVRGVIFKDGKYQAQITFKKKRYYLGRFSRLEDAVRVRKRAEERIQEYADAYLAGEDPGEIDLSDIV